MGAYIRLMLPPLHMQLFFMNANYGSIPEFLSLMVKELEQEIFIIFCYMSLDLCRVVFQEWFFILDRLLTMHFNSSYSVGGL